MVPGNAVESFSDVGRSLQDDLLQGGRSSVSEVSGSSYRHLGKSFFYSPLISRNLPGKFMVTQKGY